MGKSMYLGLILATATPGGLAGQTAHPVGRGSFVRLTIPVTSEHPMIQVEGWLDRITPDTIVLLAISGRAEAFPLTPRAVFEVRQSRARTGIGAAVGALLGGVALELFVNAACNDSCGGGDGGNGFLLGAALGAGAGALVGSNLHKTWWTPIGRGDIHVP